MGAFNSQFVWNISSSLTTCPNCASDVVKVRQDRRVEEGNWQDGDLVECQCCSHEGVVELYAGEGCPPADMSAKVTWDEVESVPGVV